MSEPYIPVSEIGLLPNEDQIISNDSRSPMYAEYDALLIDLDGTVFVGNTPVPGAVEVVAALPAAQVRFVTNNASRRSVEVVEHLRYLGFDAASDQVITSAKAGARLVARDLPRGSLVLVIGTESLVAEVAEAGMVPTRTAAGYPRAVIQGHSTETSWSDLSEAALAIESGAEWIATNVDTTIPSERGLLLGNGSMVAAVSAATKAKPTIAGKPGSPMLQDAIQSIGATVPLVVGDRLDTDIESANKIEADSLMVLTGVNSLCDVLAAPVDRRPTHIAIGIQALLDPASVSLISMQHAWDIQIYGSSVHISARSADAKAASVLPALVEAVWTAQLGSAKIGRLAVSSNNSTVTRMLRNLGVG